MKKTKDTLSKELIESHRYENIKARIRARYKQSYIKDVLLGGIDGSVSTFAIVAGTIGGGFPSIVALVLGASSFIADSLIMAISNFQATKSIGDQLEQVRKEQSLISTIFPKAL